MRWRFPTDLLGKMSMMRTTCPHLTGTTPRRVLATRNAEWARSLARVLAGTGVRPNGASVAGIAFALAASMAFVVSPACNAGGRAGLLLAAAACIQLRLLCNLLDGMLAVEEGLKTRTGEIFNDLPDRLEDVLILVGAGYAPGLPQAATLGWAAAVAAVFTAYVRVLGGSLGLTQHFAGPMAKQHRMFVLTLATVLAAIESLVGLPARALPIGLAVVVAGSVATSLRRTRRILREADAR
jgi:phosphatidylglycerophosphate synthase